MRRDAAFHFGLYEELGLRYDDYLRRRPKSANAHHIKRHFGRPSRRLTPPFRPDDIAFAQDTRHAAREKTADIAR